MTYFSLAKITFPRDNIAFPCDNYREGTQNDRQGTRSFNEGTRYYREGTRYYPREGNLFTFPREKIAFPRDRKKITHVPSGAPYVCEPLSIFALGILTVKSASIAGIPAIELSEDTHLPIGETVRGTLDLCLVHVIFIYLMIVE